MGTFCHLQNVVLLLWYKDTFIDSYCLLQNDYTYFHLCLLWVESVLYINCQSTWSVLILHTLQYPYGYRQGYGYGVWIYMDTPHSIISIWIQTRIRIMDLHGCGDTLHSKISIWTQILPHVCISSMLHTLDIKTGTILYLIIQGF